MVSSSFCVLAEYITSPADGETAGAAPALLFKAMIHRADMGLFYRQEDFLPNQSGFKAQAAKPKEESGIISANHLQPPDIRQ